MNDVQQEKSKNNPDCVFKKRVGCEECEVRGNCTVYGDDTLKYLKKKK